MIEKITKLKNIGIFDFEWNDQKVPLFKKYNILYGWNCTGKTTISRLFSILESGENKRLDLEKDSICIFKTPTEKITISFDQLPEKNGNIKVFDEDFVTENLQWDKNHAKPILIVGRAKIDQKNELDKTREKKTKNKKTLAQIKTSIQESEKEKNRILEKARSKIKKELSFIEDVKPKSDRALLYRTYSTIDVENILQGTNFSFPKFSDKEKLEKKYSLEEKVALPKLDDFNVDLNWFDDLINNSNQIFSTTLSDKVISNISSEIGDNEKLSNWLEVGHELHEDNRKSIICKFCKNEILKSRLNELDQFFDEETKKLTHDIKDAITILDKYKIDLPPAAEKFYKEYEISIFQARENFSATRQSFERKISDLKTNGCRRLKI